MLAWSPAATAAANAATSGFENPQARAVRPRRWENSGRDTGIDAGGAHGAEFPTGDGIQSEAKAAARTATTCSRRALPSAPLPILRLTE
jgi:hypothetical protein